MNRATFKAGYDKAKCIPCNDNQWKMVGIRIKAEHYNAFAMIMAEVLREIPRTDWMPLRINPLNINK